MAFFSDLYLPVIGLKTEVPRKSPYSVRIQENTDKKRLFVHFSRNDSSSVNEVIRAVINSLFYFIFLQKDFARTKSTKAQRCNQAKAQNATSEEKEKMRLKNI